MLARLALRPIMQTETHQQGEGSQLSQVSLNFGQLNAAPSKSPEQRVIDLMVRKSVPMGVSKFAGFGDVASQQLAGKEGEEVQERLMDVSGLTLEVGYDAAGDGSSGSENVSAGASGEEGEAVSPQTSYTSSGDELDDALAQQLTPMSCKTDGGDRDGQSSPMADLILMMMTPAPPTHISVLDQ